ncbi:MAG: hypothetical protein CM15mP22_0930 [Gammaproteobacteria bacterium]|nr:MAG: hypothetical protein CM15mP22_0930 [Gammaproteobacteria bacterium]
MKIVITHFFYIFPHPQPHVPLFASEDFKGSTGKGLYADVISEIDYSVGRVLKALEDNGIAENTIVVFTSDNGPWLSYGDHAGSSGIFREGKGTAGKVDKECHVLSNIQNKLRRVL